MRLVWGFIFLCGSAWANVYLHPQADLARREIKLSFLPDIIQETTIHKCWLLKHKQKWLPLDINVQLNPTNEVRAHIVTLRLPNEFQSVNDFQFTSVSCKAPHFRSTPWTFTPHPNQQSLPAKWKVVEGKLIVPSGISVISKNVSLYLRELVIQPQANLLLAENVSLHLHAETIAPIAQLKVGKSSAKNWGTFFLSTPQKISANDITVEGGSDSIVDHFPYTASTLLKAKEIQLSGSRFINSQAHTALSISQSSAILNDIHIQHARTDALRITGSKVHLQQSRLDDSGNTALVVANESQLQASDSIIANAVFGFKIETHSAANLQELTLKNVRVGISAKTSRASAKNLKLFDVALKESHDAKSEVLLAP